jgi:GTPase SAR1 family protein
MAKSKKVNKSAIIRKLHDEGKSIEEIKAQTKYSDGLVRLVIRNYKKKSKKKAQFKSPRSRLVQEIFQTIKEIPAPVKEFDWVEIPDPVNHPPHYTKGGIETIDFIEAKDLNYRLGNVIKYVSRAGKKDSDPIVDLEKAAWYLQREILARKEA